MNNPENEMKTGRTNSKTKCRKQATLKKIGRVKTQIGSEMDHGLLGWGGS